MIDDEIETLDAPGVESLGGSLARAVLWGAVFLEIVIIYGVRS
jgi:hypothetical protein